MIISELLQEYQKTEILLLSRLQELYAYPESNRPRIRVLEEELGECREIIKLLKEYRR